MAPGQHPVPFAGHPASPHHTSPGHADVHRAAGAREASLTIDPCTAWAVAGTCHAPSPAPPPRSVAARSLRQGEQSYCLLITPSRLSASTPQGKPVSRAPSGGPFAPRALPSPRSPLCCSQKPLCYPPLVGRPLPLHPLTTGCWPLPAAIPPQRLNTMTPASPPWTTDQTTNSLNRSHGLAGQEEGPLRAAESASVTCTFTRQTSGEPGTVVGAGPQHGRDRPNRCGLVGGKTAGQTRGEFINIQTDQGGGRSEWRCRTGDVRHRVLHAGGARREQAWWSGARLDGAAPGGKGPVRAGPP